LNRRVWLAALTVASTVGFVLSTSSATAGGGPHPHFADAGAITWYRSLAEAQAVARATNRLIFIESGRLQCTQCRKLVSNILPQEPIRSRMNAVAVGFADDCDDEASPCKALLAQCLPGATMLPLCGFVTADLRWVTGWYGSTTPGAVQQHLTIAEERCRRVAPLVAPAPAPTRTPAPAPPPPAPRPPTPMRTSMPAQMPAQKPRPAPFFAPTPPAPPRPTPPAVPRDDVPSPAMRKLAPLAALPPPAPVTGAPPPPPQRPARLPAPIERARAAAVREQWGEVLRMDEDAHGLTGSDGAEMAALADRANQWVARTMNDAERFAGDRHPDAALRALDGLSLALAGTIHPASVDAVRGQDAMRVLQQIERASPNDPTADMLRKDAYARFRGSRWAPLFRSR